MLISGPGLLLLAVEACGVVCIWAWPNVRTLARAAALATAVGRLLAAVLAAVLAASGEPAFNWGHVGTGVAAAFAASV